MKKTKDPKIEQELVALRAIRDRFNAIAGHCPVAILCADGSGRCVYVNARWCELAGQTEDAALDYGWQEAVHPDDRNQAIDHTKAVGRERVVQQLEFRLCRPDGSVTWVLGQFAPEPDQSGEVSGWIGSITDVTKAKDAIAARDEAQRRMERIVSYAQDCFWSTTIGEDGIPTVKYVSPAWKTIWGYEPEDIYRDPDLWVNAALPEDRATAEAAFEEVRTTGRSTTVRYRVRSKSGDIRWIEDTMSPVRDRSGRVVALDGIARDITERQMAAETIRQTEERYRRLFEEAPLMYVVTSRGDDAPTIRDCNGSFLDTLGYERSMVTGKPLTDFYALASRQALVEGGYELALRGEFVDQERQLLTRDGRIVETLLRARPEFDANGMITGTRAMYVDITKRKQAEEELRISEERYRGLFEQSKDAIFITSVDGEMVDINRAGVELFGFPSKSQLMKANIAHDLYTNPADREQMGRVLAERGFIKDYELTLRTSDGNELTVLETATAIRDDDGMVLGYQGILRDVTEQRALEAQYRHAQKMEAVGRLAGGVAHDFNNLLTVISGYAHVVLSQTSSEDSRRPALEEIQRAAQLAGSLTQRLLAFSRRRNLEPRVVDLNTVIADFEEMLRRTIGGHIKLLTELESDPTPIQADPGQVEQIIMNLVVNARDAMPAGGTVTVATANVQLDQRTAQRINNLQSGSYIKLSVADTGMGMDADTVSRIFDPFYTTKPAGKGTGLGLSNVYAVVDQSAGGIAVHSVPDKGTVMTVYLPRVEGTASGGKTEEAVGGVRSASETILVVEDDQAVLGFVAGVLERRGYRVLRSEHPDQALELSVNHVGPIHVLVTDVLMPGMSGVELAKRIVDRRPETLVLYMSGHTGDSFEVAERSITTTPLLQKPFGPNDLVDSVVRVLARSARWQPPDGPA